MSETYTKGAYFSANQGAFCLVGLRASYAAWPSDAVAVSDAIFQEYALTPPPLGQRLGAVNGQPGWVSAS